MALHDRESIRESMEDTVYAGQDLSTALPKFRFPSDEIAPSHAFQVIADEMMLDGNARLNLATFVGTWMDDEATKLYVEAADKNMVDKDEYPATAAVETTCVKMVAAMWNAKDPDNTIGTSTIGSSEAAMLGGLAMKRKWSNARKAAGKSTEKPNLVLSSAVQVCWEKFCNYFEVEARFVPISLEHKVLVGYELEKYVDENTIGVVCIMGVTYTGMYEPVKEVSAKLDQIQKDTGLDIPIHVDGASGGFIAPFCQPDLEWDFRVDRVGVDLGAEVLEIQAGYYGIPKAARPPAAPRPPTTAGTCP